VFSAHIPNVPLFNGCLAERDHKHNVSFCNLIARVCSKKRRMFSTLHSRSVYMLINTYMRKVVALLPHREGEETYRCSWLVTPGLYIHIITYIYTSIYLQKPLVRVPHREGEETYKCSELITAGLYIDVIIHVYIYIYIHTYIYTFICGTHLPEAFALLQGRRDVFSARHSRSIAHLRLRVEYRRDPRFPLVCAAFAHHQLCMNIYIHVYIYIYVYK